MAEVELKLQPRYYNGDINGPDSIQSWIQHYETISKSNNWGDAKMLAMLPVFLVGSAQNFHNVESNATTPPATWKEWKERMLDRFSKVDYTENLRAQLLYCRRQSQNESPVAFLDELREIAFKVLKLKPKFLEMCASATRSSVAELRVALQGAETLIKYIKIQNAESGQDQFAQETALLKTQINELQFTNTQKNQNKQVENDNKQKHNNNYNHNKNFYRGNSRGRNHRGNSNSTGYRGNNQPYRSSYCGFPNQSRGRGFSNQSRGRGFRGQGRGHRGFYNPPLWDD